METALSEPRRGALRLNCVSDLCGLCDLALERFEPRHDPRIARPVREARAHVEQREASEADRLQHPSWSATGARCWLPAAGRSWSKG